MHEWKAGKMPETLWNTNTIIHYALTLVWYDDKQFGGRSRFLRSGSRRPGYLSSSFGIAVIVKNFQDTYKTIVSFGTLLLHKLLTLIQVIFCKSIADQIYQSTDTLFIIKDTRIEKKQY